MRNGAKCEAYGAPCKNPATKLVEIWDKKNGWVTMIFCDYCYADFVRECANDPDFGPVKL